MSTFAGFSGLEINFPGHFGACNLGWRMYVILGSFMARLQGLMVIGMWIDRRLIQIQLWFYVMEDSRVRLAVGWKFYSLTAATMCSRARAGYFSPLHIGFRLKSTTMSCQRGTPRHANSTRAKTQRGCSATVSANYEQHISAWV